MIRVENKKTSLLLALLIGLFAFASADAQVYGGRSFGVSASTTTNGATTGNVFADTGQLPPAGGNITISAPSSAVPGLLSTGVLTASTSGALKSSQSVTVANDVNIVVGGYRIVVDRVTANAGCICCPGAEVAACSGSTSTNAFTITNLSTGEQSRVGATGEVNQVVNLPGTGTITINEQITAAGSITVNGLRVQATSGGTTSTITVASATSALDCVTLRPSAGEVTVSGRVLTRAGTAISKATVTVTDGSGNVRTATTNTFGRYSISLLDAGTTYIVHAAHRSYTFEPVVVTADSEVTVDLVAN